MDPFVSAIVGFLVVIVYPLVLLALLSRTSPWTHATQKKLDLTNAHLEQLGRVLDARLPRQ